MGATEFAAVMLAVSVLDVPKGACVKAWLCRLFHGDPVCLHRRGVCCVCTKCWRGTGCNA
jgi:hypothetical protein